MWVHRLVAPYEFERIEVPDLTEQQLGDGQVLLSFVAAGVCGSDLPAFRGAQGRLPGDSGASAAEKNGFPIHEIVGDVLASCAGLAAISSIRCWSALSREKRPRATRRASASEGMISRMASISWRL